MKISFDYDGVLSKSSHQIHAMDLISKGDEVYIISARSNDEPLLLLADKLGILRSRVFATGSNKRKVEKVNELGIETHFDNNPDVIKELGNKGKLAN